MDFLGISPAELRNGLILYIILVASLSVHEWAHAYSADRLGDDTPRSQGRVTLNPLVHMDLFGTVIFPLMFIFVFDSRFFFGWGRPVMVNVSNFRHRTRDHIIVTLAGPGSNLLLAFLGAVVGGLVYGFDSNTTELFGLVIGLNVVLAVFNMIPIPPLDGGQVMRHVVGMSEETFMNLSRWGFLILIVAINLPPIRYALGLAIMTVQTPFFLLYELIAT
jgi:Zn-dependent protease